MLTKRLKAFLLMTLLFAGCHANKNKNDDDDSWWPSLG